MAGVSWAPLRNTEKKPKLFQKICAFILTFSFADHSEVCLGRLENLLCTCSESPHIWRRLLVLQNELRDINSSLLSNSKPSHPDPPCALIDQLPGCDRTALEYACLASRRAPREISSRTSDATPSHPLRDESRSALPLVEYVANP